MLRFPLKAPLRASASGSRKPKRTNVLIQDPERSGSWIIQVPESFRFLNVNIRSLLKLVQQHQHPAQVQVEVNDVGAVE